MRVIFFKERFEYIGLEMDLPVIMMSADEKSSVVMKGVMHGACDYLIKPVGMEALRNIWQHVIRKKNEVRKDLEPSTSLTSSVYQQKQPETTDKSSANKGQNGIKRRKLLINQYLILSHRSILLYGTVQKAWMDQVQRRSVTWCPVKLASAVWDDISMYKTTIANFPQTETCELLIIDRSIDLIAGKINKVIRDEALRDLGQVEQDLVFGEAATKEVINFLRANQDTKSEYKLRL